MRYKIIAVDFDGTMHKGYFPNIGEPNYAVINALIEEKEKGTKLILWTCREGVKLKEAVKWSESHGVYFDAVNENLLDVVVSFGVNSRKIVADEYWDDKAVNINLQFR